MAKKGNRWMFPNKGISFSSSNALIAQKLSEALQRTVLSQKFKIHATQPEVRLLPLELSKPDKVFASYF